jgi:hypothetical protein
LSSNSLVDSRGCAFDGHLRVQAIDRGMCRMHTLCMVLKESQDVPPPEDVLGVAIRTVDDQPALVFTCHDGQRVVVPVALRPVPSEARRAA